MLKKNIASEKNASTGVSTDGSQAASISDQPRAVNSGSHSLPLQYTSNGVIPTTYAYGTPAELIPDSQQAPSSQTNILPQMNAAYNVLFNLSQPIPSQRSTNMHSNIYEASAYFSQQFQHQQQQPPQ